MQDTVTLSLARMLACNSSLTELGLSKHRMVDSQLETLVRLCVCTCVCIYVCASECVYVCKHRMDSQLEALVHLCGGGCIVFVSICVCMCVHVCVKVPYGGKPAGDAGVCMCVPYACILVGNFAHSMPSQGAHRTPRPCVEQEQAAWLWRALHLHFSALLRVFLVPF